jgi:sporulation protein YlmC with PRC-barrel domain
MPEYSKGDIISKPIYDRNGKCIGNVTGRKDIIENTNKRDLTEMIERGNRQKRDIQERR